ncbi:NADH-quinone oxidoreductase subunit L [Lichenicola cladoniae]|uniref:NADH-quinone oxidoreductase subunit L n=1 Tax=Lichenicola cladoniae TaxID=1484109 RepID=A0A6M8HQ37_9PROT|nr:NADH-quinone oxidoreductase subunit L [Lichenicola cladoniae]NPD69698.1 NADH-quinone oxidoreductase subunit L [Acetobacteraceae bacterium]QKE90400.1 NADH-quinone oxidoreductase subunit L [Lichenicola cladoniae]
MHALLAFVLIFPLLGSVILMLGGRRLGTDGVRIVGVGSVGIAAILACIVATTQLAPGGAVTPFDLTLWHWMRIGSFAPDVALRLDGLSLAMMLVITVIGFLIHLYASAYMDGDAGYARFFAYMNLFVAAMLLLVLANDLLALYVGWEGVGLCSYLLIGFWYDDPANGRAARKAFIVTRIGDTALITGLFLLATQFGTLSIQPLMQQAATAWPQGSLMPTVAAFLLLGGALGKSAQLPLQTWLVDAMAGPTPVSALIHAATMVTAGVYLIARTHVLFALAPDAMLATGAIGAITLLLSGASALVQTDIKRILAYSTISQIGYMFLALGVGAWDAAIFHLVTHAFFKALLFLSAGAIILRLHHEQDIFRMGGLRRSMPGVFWCFLIGSASLAALPLITAGFYSKEAILQGAWNGGAAGRVLWCAGLVGAFLTALYIFRAFFIVFLGPVRTVPHGVTGWRIGLPLGVLSVLALIGGFLQTPALFGSSAIMSHLLGGVFGVTAETVGESAWPLVVASLVPLVGIGLAWRRFSSQAELSPSQTATARLLRTGWGFDTLYDTVIVGPLLWLVHINRDDIIDRFYEGIAVATRHAHDALRLTQTGRVRWYAGWVAAGSITALAIGLFA